MGFFNKVQMFLSRWMAGRNGLDNLGFVALWSGLIISLVDTFIGTGILSLLGMGVYIYAIWRMLSRNLARRAEENRRYVVFSQNVKTKVRQFFMRLKNSREYKYFHCPQCRVLIRLKRGSGEKDIHCPKCSCNFKQRA